MIGPYKVLAIDHKTRTLTYDKDKKALLSTKVPPFDAQSIKAGNSYFFDIKKKGVIDRVELVSTSFVIHAEDLVLLTKRKGFPFQGYWELPSAYETEPARKLAEDYVDKITKVMPSPIRYRMMNPFRAPKRDPSITHSRCYPIVVTLPDPIIVDSKIGQWFPLSEINAMSLAFDHRNIIKTALVALRR